MSVSPPVWEEEDVSEVQLDIAFLSCLIRTRPIGAHKHILILKLQDEIYQRTRVRMEIPDMWDRLAGMYDLEALDRRNPHVTPLSAGVIAKYAPHLAPDLELPPPRSPVLAALPSTASISASDSDLGSGEGSAEASVSDSSTSTLVSRTDPYDKAADATLGGLESPTSLDNIATVAIPFAEDPACRIGTELERVGGQSLVELERGKKRARTTSAGSSMGAVGWMKRPRQCIAMGDEVFGDGDGDEAERGGDTTEDDDYEAADTLGDYDGEPASGLGERGLHARRDLC